MNYCWKLGKYIYIAKFKSNLEYEDEKVGLKGFKLLYQDSYLKIDIPQRNGKWFFWKEVEFP